MTTTDPQPSLPEDDGGGDDAETSTATTTATPEQALRLILDTLLPFLLAAALDVRAFPGKWAHLRTKLSQLQSSLAPAADTLPPGWPSHPLLPDLLLSVLRTLRSLRTLHSRCLDPTLPSGKLLLQSDLDIAASSLSLHLHDLHLLLRSGLLTAPQGPGSSTTAAADDNDHQHHLLQDTTHLCHPAAIVLTHPGPAASKEDLALFVRDLFARLLIGSLDLKKKALDSLLRLLEDPPGSATASPPLPKIAALVAEEGDVACLVHLLDLSNHSLIREHAAAAVSALASASDISRKAVFEEGALGPLLRLLDSGSAPAREKAAMAVEAITADHGNAWAVPAYGGVPVLIEACRSGSGGLPATQAKACGALRNVAAAVPDARESMAEDGAVPVLVGMLASSSSAAGAGGGTGATGTITNSYSSNGEALRNAVHCLWILASGSDDMRASILHEGALHKLLTLFRDTRTQHHHQLQPQQQQQPDPDLSEHILRALHALSATPSASKSLSSSTPFLIQISDLITQSPLPTQLTAASLLCNLSPTDDSKRSMSACLPALVKMMELPKPAGSQEIAARALVSLLAVRSNRKDLTKDEKSMRRLVMMLDPDFGEGLGKRFPVSVVLALAAGTGGGGCQKRVAAAGACQPLQKLADLDVPGAKKALQRLTGGRFKNLLSSITWRE